MNCNKNETASKDVCVDLLTQLQGHSNNVILSYDNIRKATEHGACVQHPTAGLVPVPFDFSMKIWEQLVLIVCSMLRVYPQRVLDTSGVRPSNKIYQARSCLIQALFQIIKNEDVATRWLMLQGFSSRRIKLLREFALDEDAQACLNSMPCVLTLKLNLTD